MVAETGTSRHYQSLVSFHHSRSLARVPPNRRYTFETLGRVLTYRGRYWACPCPTVSCQVEEWVIRTRSPWLIDRSPSYGFVACLGKRLGHRRTLAKK